MPLLPVGTNRKETLAPAAAPLSAWVTSISSQPVGTLPRSVRVAPAGLGRLFQVTPSSVQASLVRWTFGPS